MDTFVLSKMYVNSHEVCQNPNGKKKTVLVSMAHAINDNQSIKWRDQNASAGPPIDYGASIVLLEK